MAQRSHGQLFMCLTLHLYRLAVLMCKRFGADTVGHPSSAMRQRLKNPPTNQRCSNGNNNQFFVGQSDRHCRHIAGAVLHRQVFAGPDRGQVNATPQNRVNHQPQDHRGAADAGAIQRMAQIGWRPLAAEVPD